MDRTTGFGLALVLLIAYVFVNPIGEGPSPTPTPTSTWALSFQPQDGYCWTGAWNEGGRDYTTIKNELAYWKASTGKGVYLLGFWELMTYPITTDIDTAKRLIDEGLLGGIVLALQGGGGESGSEAINKIASGGYDSKLTTIAQKLKDFGYPSFIRFFAEFNGQWSSAGDSPTVFKNAFIRARNIFRDVGARTEFWFSPVPYPLYPDRPAPISDNWPWQDYYPGDDYVDWITPSFHDYTLYAWSHSQTAEQTFDQLANPFLSFASQHGKAMAFPETSFYDDYYSDDYGVPRSYQVAFTSKFFSYVDSNDRVKAYVVYDFSAAISKPEILSVYKQRVTSNRYIGR